MSLERKMVEGACKEFVVIVDETKSVKIFGEIKLTMQSKLCLFIKKL